MKKLLAAILCLAMLLCVFGGCAPKTPDTEQTLEIYNLHNGYGNDWVESVIDSFKKQQWVKEKYPELKVVFQHNDIYGAAHNYLSMGKAANTVDLLFGAFMKSYAGKPDIADITDSVYNSTVPGESATVLEKLIPSVADGNKYLDPDSGETSFYTMSYVSGMTGIMYNEDILSDVLKMEVPLTTDMFCQTMEAVRGLNGKTAGYPYGYSIMAAAGDGYWYPMFSTWWAQYEGVEGYENFYKGIDDGRITKDIFKQTGRRKSLEILEEIFRDENGYLYTDAFTADYSMAQTNFLVGNGIFHCNGDYFTAEMELIRKELRQSGYDYTIKYMKTPVISSIVERLRSVTAAAAARSVTNDEMLRLLIKDIDANVTECRYLNDGVTQRDYEELTKARNMVQSGSSLAGLIPDYANGKEVAIDFLRFMATDIAYDAVIERTKGHLLPFQRDVASLNPEVYNALEPEQKTKIDMYANKTMPITIVADPDAFDLGRAGLTPLASSESNGKVNFESVFGQKDSKVTAQSLWQKDIDYWNETRWQQLLGAAGK